MNIDLAVVYAATQTAQFLLQQANAYQRGEMTEQEIRQSFSDLGLRMDEADRLWEDSKRIRAARETGA